MFLICKMKTSVALCTYNGEKFLAEQLDSILNQTAQIDEIIVCDDGSTDRTIEILQNYHKAHPKLFHIHQNVQNLRSVKNFEKAIQLCTGDIIFLSDQDDIWQPEKAERFINYFHDHKHIDVVCSNGFGINENGELLDVLTVWDVPEMLEKQGKCIDFHTTFSIVGNIATGANMALRKSFLPKVLPFPVIKDYHHDEWIAMNAAYGKKFGFIIEKLTKYRQHSSQQVGGVFYPNNSKNAKSLVSYFTVEEEITSFSQGKKILKRFANAYNKNKQLLANFPEKNQILEENMILAQQKFLVFYKKFLNKYWLRARVQFFADKIMNKRRLEI